MAANKLVINDDKTHLLVLGTKSMVEKRNLVRMQASNHTIMPSNLEKVLGCIVSDNLKCRHHILDNEQSMVRQLTSRVIGYDHLQSRLQYKTDGGQWVCCVQGLLSNTALGWH